jgi:glycerophosphoryl diester phosphodiesterase
VTPAGLREIAGYADVIGPDKNQIVPRDAAGALLLPIQRLHREGRLR